MDKNIRRKAVGKPKEADLPKYSPKERRKKFSKNISWEMYYQGKVRPVYFQGKRVDNICYNCANNHYHAYGDEELCRTCTEFKSFKGRTKIINFKISFFNWLNKRGIHARPTKNWPFIKID